MAAALAGCVLAGCVLGGVHAKGHAEGETCSSHEDLSMLQQAQPGLRLGDKDISYTNSAFACAPLTHQGSFSTVDVAVGTPGQVFSIVADTGSDSVIIPSCVCQETHNCHSGDRCFTGTGRSSSFHIKKGASGPPGAVLTFGSGPIKVAIASDLVRLGGVVQDMEDGVLLMVDHDLDFGGSFEGILGLGLPTTAKLAADTAPHVDSPEQYVLAANSTEALRVEKTKRGGDGLSFADVKGDRSKVLSLHAGSIGLEASAKTERGWEPYARAGFLETARVSRFSMCFNDGSAGALRLNPSPAPLTLANVGREHWAVDFRGVSIGRGAGPVGFCGAGGLGPDQETPCAGIPDSGTTAIMGPQAHLDLLYESLCDGWDRCSRSYAAAAAASNSSASGARKMASTPAGASKKDVFELLLRNCGTWLDSDDRGLDELPPIYFGIRGSDGAEQEVEMPGWAYVTSSEAMAGTICESAFSAIEYSTTANGPVWIFGTPFFFTHEVGYDLQTSPPGMSFTSLRGSSCGSCEAAEGEGASAALVATAGRERRPRVRTSAPRRPSIDTRRPL